MCHHPLCWTRLHLRGSEVNITMSINAWNQQSKDTARPRIRSTSKSMCGKFVDLNIKWRGRICSSAHFVKRTTYSMWTVLSTCELSITFSNWIRWSVKHFRSSTCQKMNCSFFSLYNDNVKRISSQQDVFLMTTTRRKYFPQIKKKGIWFKSMCFFKRRVNSACCRNQKLRMSSWNLKRRKGSNIYCEYHVQDSDGFLIRFSPSLIWSEEELETMKQLEWKDVSSTEAPQSWTPSSRTNDSGSSRLSASASNFRVEIDTFSVSDSSRWRDNRPVDEMMNIASLFIPPRYSLRSRHEFVTVKVTTRSTARRETASAIL